MAIFNTTKTLNQEIRLYGPEVQKVIAFEKARSMTKDIKTIYYNYAHNLNDFQ